MYRKIPIISPGLIFVQKAFLVSLFSEGLITGWNFAFQNGLGLTIKQLALTGHERAYYQKDFASEIWGGGGGAYFWEGLIFFFFWGGGLIFGILRYVVFLARNMVSH